MKFLTLFTTLLLSACATRSPHPEVQLISESQYESVIEKYTQRKQVYDGFQMAIDISATLINTPVAMAQVDQNARIYQWDLSQYNENKRKAEEAINSRTEIFLSFFAPERKHDDLAKGKTLWKIFLDANGKRYEGKAVKQKTILADVVSLYPHHNRWSSAYKIKFDVPVTQIEGTESKLTITGPVGTTSAQFPIRAN